MANPLVQPNLVQSHCSRCLLELRSSTNDFIEWHFNNEAKRGKIELDQNRFVEFDQMRFCANNRKPVQPNYKFHNLVRLWNWQPGRCRRRATLNKYLDLNETRKSDFSTHDCRVPHHRVFFVHQRYNRTAVASLAGKQSPEYTCHIRFTFYSTWVGRKGETNGELHRINEKIELESVWTGGDSFVMCRNLHIY